MAKQNSQILHFFLRDNNLLKKANYYFNDGHLIFANYIWTNDRLEFIPTFKISKNFLKKNVSIKKRYFKEHISSQTSIGVNKLINLNFFEKVFINSNGDVYNSTFRPTIGIIYNISLNAIIKSQINDFDSIWYYTRQKVISCKTCLYNCICPPIEEFEFSLDKFDLCWNNKLL